MNVIRINFTDLNQMFDYAVPREWIQGNPTSGIKKKDVGGADNEGDRVLTPEELVMVQTAMRAQPARKSRYYAPVRTVVPIRTELAVWLAVSTLARSIEIATMRRSYVHVERAIWEIPPEIAKNDKIDVIVSDFGPSLVGALPVFPTNALKYNLTWSVDGLVNEYCHPCEAIQGGERISALPLEGLEHFSLDGTEYEAFNTSGGLGTLCETLSGKVEMSMFSRIWLGVAEVVRNATPRCTDQASATSDSSPRRQPAQPSASARADSTATGWR